MLKLEGTCKTMVSEIIQVCMQHCSYKQLVDLKCVDFRGGGSGTFGATHALKKCCSNGLRQSCTWTGGCFDAGEL